LGALAVVACGGSSSSRDTTLSAADRFFMGQSIEAKPSQRRGSQLGGKPPIPSLTDAFSSGSIRGVKVDKSE
jgi:hypothetical protein